MDEKAQKFGTVAGNAAKEFIQSCPLFAVLPDEDINEMCGKMTGRSFQAHEQVFAQGSIGQEFFVIVEGTAHVSDPKFGLTLS